MTTQYKGKTREIRNWNEVRVARIDHDCDGCGTTIHATQIYERRVLAYRTTLDPEKRHSEPCCPDRCY